MSKLTDRQARAQRHLERHMEQFVRRVGLAKSVELQVMINETIQAFQAGYLHAIDDEAGRRVGETFRDEEAV